MKQEILDFQGMFQRWQPHLLPTGGSQEILDADIVSGGIVPFYRPLQVHMVDKPYTNFFLYRRSPGTDEQWLLFEQDYINIVPSAIYNDQYNRHIISGIDDGLRVFDSNTLPIGDTTVTIANSVRSRMDRPATPTLSLVDGNSGSLADKTVSYCISFVRVWPNNDKIDMGPTSSPAETAEGTTYVDVDATHTPRLDFARVENDANYTGIVVYRAATGTAGDGVWREVLRVSYDESPEDYPDGLSFDGINYTFLDRVPDEELGAVLDHQDYTQPEKLEGLISLHNGVLAAFHGKTVYFSVPYQEYAWPESQSVTVDYNIIGLGVFSNTVVVCTEALTYTCVANDPTAPIFIPIQESLPCVARKSIVNFANCSVYASDFGLVKVSSAGVSIPTDDNIGGLYWSRLNPKTIVAAPYDGRYLAFFTNDFTNYRGVLLDIDISNLSVASELQRGALGFSYSPGELWYDVHTSTTYTVMKNALNNRWYICIIGKNTLLSRLFSWTSKKFFVSNAPTGLTTPAALRVDFLHGTAQLPTPGFDILTGESPLINGHLVHTYLINGDMYSVNNNAGKVGRFCQVLLYADDELWCTLSVTDADPIRIPAGMRCSSWYIKINSTEPISRVQVGTSIGELV